MSNHIGAERMAVAHAGTDFMAELVGQQIRASIPISGEGFLR